MRFVTPKASVQKSQSLSRDLLNDKADFQAMMNAMAFNIKRWMSLLNPVAIT